LLQLKEEALVSFEKTSLEDGLQLDMECDDHPRCLDEYIQAWKIQMWKYVFLEFFKENDAYLKTKAFGDHKHIDLVVKHVIFRYFCPFYFQSLSFFGPTTL
jgi:hypothetical protein